ncbi:hypothetical protein NC653_039873 [Populus alba x Populus x berolinensis]|uniref:DUF676 domain-containing protein n=1 Tax=Populus alba x Populus x berolinensis TaxID=444605 RepID=A0AAD6LC99_9ROSI|nr:hypothetical protein NC653_039873 [Populus alba x Populus x berolinensis]
MIAPFHSKHSPPPPLSPHFSHSILPSTPSILFFRLIASLSLSLSLSVFFDDSLPRMIAAVSPLSPPKHTAVFIHTTNPFSFPLHSGADPAKMDWIRKRMNFRCFNKRTDSKVLKVEVESGGEDFMDAAVAEARVSPQHLVIMVNGIIGSSADWRYAADQFVKKLPDKILVHRSECNHSKLTFDGVDLMGDRLAEEVLAVVRHRPEVRKISFVAHSLGGLVARYAIARLYENLPKSAHSNLTENSLDEEHTNSMHCLEQPCEARIAGLEPVNFITFATPHLGSRGNKQLPILCGLPFLERRASQTAHLIVGRTGKHLFLTDNDNGIPLLLQMVNDSDGLRFISALRAFKRRVVYANANYDHIVGWGTSSIRRQNELPKSNLLVTDNKYPHIVYVERERGDHNSDKKTLVVGKQTTDLEVVWIKINCHPVILDLFVLFSFLSSSCSYIQVKSYWLNSDGADVVFHMIDNFLL